MAEYPIRAYGYDGKIHLDRPTPSEWRAFRLAQARKLGTHTSSEWIELRDKINKCMSCERTDMPLVKDHIFPISKGGCDCIHNLQPLCKPCNSAKCDRIVQ
jgi:hypothetical protein